jgi:hypothetical protein
MAWNTKIKFVNIPFYRINDGSEIYFKTKTLMDNYFLNHVISEYDYTNQSYMRIEAGEFKCKVNCDTLMSQCPNFIMFQNKDFGNRWFIANILNIVYVSPNVSRISYATHPLYSFWDLLDFSKQSYIVRRTWSGKNDDETELMELPYEEIDTGESYQILDNTFDFNDTTGNYETEQFYYILMTRELTTGGSTHNIVTTQKQIKYLDGNEVRTLTSINGYNSVLYAYVMNFKCLNELLNRGVFGESCSLVNTLQQVSLLPFGRSMFKGNLNNIKNNISIKLSDGSTFSGSSLSADCELYDQSNFGDLYDEKQLRNWCSRLTNYINHSIDKNYDGEFNDNLPTSAIGKYLYRYPFSILSSYDGINNEVNYKIEELNRCNELQPIKDKSLSLFKYASLGQAPLLAYCFKTYQNSSVDYSYNDLVTLENIITTMGTNFVSIPVTIQLAIINSYTAAFLQSNQNQINAQRQNLVDTLNTYINNLNSTLQASATSASLNRESTLLENQTVNQINAITSNLDYQNSTRSAINTLNNANIDAVSKAFQGVSTGGGAALGGHLSEGITTASNAIIGYQSDTRVAANSYRTSLQNAQNQLNANSQIMNMRLTSSNRVAENVYKAAMVQANAAYANGLRTARNNYTTEMRSLNAKLQDTRNVPPTVQSMGNNSSIFNILNNRDCIRFTTKSLPKGVMQRVINYFVFNGFLTNKAESIESIFNKFADDNGFFLQTSNANISGQIPQNLLLDIANQFNSGIYFWKPEHYQDYESMRGV